MVPYKRLDLAIRACHRLGHPLVVAGAGTAEADLRALAAALGADVQFVIAPDDGRLRQLYRDADVVVFPPEEDFGIVPVEGQACGTPVVALGRGGTLDTVIDGVTGVLVPDQAEDTFADGVAAALNRRFDPAACRANAERFSPATFRNAFLDWVIGAAAAHDLVVDDPRTRHAA
jgi:glycosyltransferase involved in cell wall biosynthesis